MALRRFRTVLDGVEGKTIDRAFEWTMIAEVLPCRGVADCVRFYYQNKHIIFMKLERADANPVPLVLSGKPEWSPLLSAELQRKVRNLFDIDRFLQYIATLEANNTILRLRNDVLEKDEKRMIHSVGFHRKRADKHKHARDELEISNAQKGEANERLKRQLKAFQRQKDEDMEAMKKDFNASQLKKDEEIESLKKQLAESQAYAEGRKIFGEWQEGRAEDFLGQAKRLEEDLKEAQQQLKSKTSHTGESKRAEKPKTEQDKVEQHKTGEDMVEQQKAEKLQVTKPTVQQPTVQQQRFQQPKIHQSSARQSGAQQPGGQQARVQQSRAQQPGSQQSRAQQSRAQRQPVHQLGLREPAAQQARFQQPRAQESGVLQSGVHQLAALQPSVQRSEAQQSGVQQETSEQPRRTGHGFLKDISHTHTPRQWRGEK